MNLGEKASIFSLLFYRFAYWKAGKFGAHFKLKN